MDRIKGAGNVGGMFVAEDMATNRPPTEITAKWLVDVQEELAAIAEYIGMTLDPNNNHQVLAAILQLIEARCGNYSLDTGAANAFVVALNPAISAYTGNFSCSFKAANGNPAGASTINFGGGIVPLLNDQAGALGINDIVAGMIVSVEFSFADNRACVTSMVQSQSDSRYLQKNNTTVGLVETFGAVGGALNRRYYDITGLVGMNYLGVPINAEWITLNNTAWNSTTNTFAGRDVAGICFAQVMTDAGQFLLFYAATAAVNTAPVWSSPIVIDIATGYNNIVPAGALVDFPTATPPTGYLARPAAATNISVAAYPALAAAIGITCGNGATTAAGAFAVGTMYVIVALGTTDFTLIGAKNNIAGTVFTATGVGTGTGTASTTFGLPVAPADYADVAANGNAGTQTVGAVIAHPHSFGVVTASGTTGTPAASGGGTNTNVGSVNSTGGVANFAAGVRVLKCIKY